MIRTCTLVLLLAPALATADFSMGAKVGTGGTGLEGVYHFDRQFALRGTIGTFTYTDVREISDINYEWELNVTGASLLLDIAPKGRNFYLTGGIFINGNTFDATAEVVDSINVGGTDYTTAELGDLSGTVDFNPIAPYIGLGWRWRNQEPGLSLGFETGLLFQGLGDVDLTATGPIASDPTFQADLARETDELEDKLGIAKLYPVIEVRIGYRF
ncbi:MAG: hypothetical protein AAFZ58_02240 [Pseudomonadota bacterium]